MQNPELIPTISTIINSPENLAAIYVRKSHHLDNYSEDTQYNACIERMYSEGLQLYNYYYEVVTAVQKHIYERKQFNNLIQAAKKGYFKTLIVFKLDRLVRRKDDLMQVINFLKKYKIRLVIADIPNNIDINDPNRQLELNLQVLSAFNEAQSTNERTTKGKRESRESGRYNPGRNLPIGYIKSNTPKEYEINKLESIIVKYIYDLAIYNIEYLNDINSLKISNTISVLLRAISENFSLNKLEQLKFKFPNDLKLINPLISFLRSNSFSDNYKANIDYCLSKLSKNNIERILSNPVYAGLHYVSTDPNAKNARFATESVIKTDMSPIGYALNLDVFVETTNIPGFIGIDSFEKTYCFLFDLKTNKKSNTIPFLLDNKIRCSCGKKLVQITPGILQCPNNCYKYYKETILKMVLNQITNTILNENVGEFDKFIENINTSLNSYLRNVEKLRLKKNRLVGSFIENPTPSNEELIYSIQKDIENLSNITASHMEVQSFLIRIKNLIIDKNNNLKNHKRVAEFLCNYILSNENYYAPIFKKFIKEVKITNAKNSRTIKSTIKFKFTSSKSGYLSSCLDRKTR